MMTALVGKTLPLLHPVRDYSGHVIFEYPLVKITEVQHRSGRDFLFGGYVNGPLVGESFYWGIHDLMAF